MTQNLNWLLSFSEIQMKMLLLLSTSQLSSLQAMAKTVSDIPTETLSHHLICFLLFLLLACFCSCLVVRPCFDCSPIVFTPPVSAAYMIHAALNSCRLINHWGSSHVLVRCLVFQRSVMREFLLTKLINAEISCYKAERFSKLEVGAKKPVF